MHAETLWKVEPSLKFDALCFLNALTGDPFYLDDYQAEYDKFKAGFTPEVQAALADLKRKVKDEGGSIISALMCRYFSTTGAETLEEMLSALEEGEPALASANLGPYYYNKRPLFESVRGELSTILRFLQAAGFEPYWREQILPKVEARIATLRGELAQYNVVAEDERYLGFALPSNEITVYVLYYTRPHGIKITGTRFLTDLTWESAIVVHNAAHEMMHPPYDLDSNEELKAALYSLQQDGFLMEKFTGHNRDYGYNTFESYIEEGCVRALDQMVVERWGIGREPHERWLDEDEGMHVFAACLYSVMKEEEYNSRQELFAGFLLRMVRTKLAPGKLRAVYDAFYSAAQPAAGGS